MLAGQRSSLGLRRWSRLGEFIRTVHSGTVSPAPRSRAAPLPAPRVCDLWCLVCLCWRSCDSYERRRRGGGRGAPRTPTHVLAIDIDAPPIRPLPFPRGTFHSTQRAPHIACDRHQYQQWCAGEGAGQRRWRVRVWSRGCAHVCKHTRTSSNAPCLHHGGG